MDGMIEWTCEGGWIWWMDVLIDGCMYGDGCVNGLMDGCVDITKNGGSEITREEH